MIFIHKKRIVSASNTNFDCQPTSIDLREAGLELHLTAQEEADRKAGYQRAVRQTYRVGLSSE
jgi:hypothetical protein